MLSLICRPWAYHLFEPGQMSGCCICVQCKRAAPCQKHPGEAEEKRLAVRVTLADSNSQVAVMLYHDMLLPDPLADTKELRNRLRDMFLWAQWLCLFAFRENDYQPKRSG